MNLHQIDRQMDGWIEANWMILRADKICLASSSTVTKDILLKRMSIVESNSSKGKRYLKEEVKRVVLDRPL